MIGSNNTYKSIFQQEVSINGYDVHIWICTSKVSV